jgi:hypothetical protein
MLYSRAALLLTFAALARCQEEELQWPQNSTSANQGPGRYNHTLHIPLEVTVSFPNLLSLFLKTDDSQPYVTGL